LPALPEISPESFAAEIRPRVIEALEAVKAAPESAQANADFGMLLHAHQQYQTAEIFYQRTRILEPDSFRWLYYLGVVQSGQGNYEQAAETLRAARQIDSQFPPARLRLAEALRSARQLEESREIYEALVREQPANAEAHYGLGRALAEQRQPAEAVTHLMRACELVPNFGAAHYALALAYRDLGEAAKSKQHLAIYEEHKTGSPPVDDPLMAAVNDLKTGASVHLRQGIQLDAAGDLEQSIAAHERAVEADPELLQAHINLVALYGRQGQVDKAEQHYRDALEINPNQAELHYNFGVLAVESGRPERAAEAFRKALEINPNYAEAHTNLGQMLEKQGRIDDALSHYRSALANKPNFRLARYHLGRMLLAKGRNQEAIEAFENTLGVEDEHTPLCLYGLMAAHARAGEYQKASEYAREARRRAQQFGHAALVGQIDSDLRKLESAGASQ
jgi:superkiller protein 3